MMMVDTTIGGVPGVRLNAPVTRQIRSQAMAVARTATASMAKEVKETVYKANAPALEGLVWEWEAALDSRTCPTCMPLDQQRWDQGDPAGLNGHCIPTAGVRRCWWTQKTPSLRIRPAQPW